MSNKKIALVSVYGLPVPAVHGGAIETIETLFADENEKYGSLDMTIYCLGSTEAVKKSAHYKRTRFVYLSNNNALYLKIRKFICRAVNHFGGKMIVHKRYYSRILKHCIRQKYDYIVFEEAEKNAMIWFAKKINNSKLYFHLHSMHKSCPDLYRALDGTVSVSKFINDVWVDSSNAYKAYKKQDNIVLVNAINEDHFNQVVSDEEKTEIRKEYGYNDDDILVLYLGRIMQEKGVIELEKAVMSIDDKRVKLLMIGNTSFADKKSSKYFQYTRQYADQSNGRIQYRDYIPNDEVYKIGKCADIRCLPSLWEEAGSLALIEAMYCGSPLVVTRSGGMPEVVDNKGAIIVEKDDNVENNIKDAIVKISSSSSLRNSMRMANLKQAKKFTSKNFYMSFVKIFERD